MRNPCLLAFLTPSAIMASETGGEFVDVSASIDSLMSSVVETLAIMDSVSVIEFSVHESARTAVAVMIMEFVEFRLTYTRFIESPLPANIDYTTLKLQELKNKFANPIHLYKVFNDAAIGDAIWFDDVLKSHVNDVGVHLIATVEEILSGLKSVRISSYVDCQKANLLTSASTILGRSYFKSAYTRTVSEYRSQLNTLPPVTGYVYDVTDPCITWSQ